MRHVPHLFMLACLAALLAACGDGRAPGGTTADTTQDAPLPKPEQRMESITGVSTRRGPGDVPLSGEAPALTPGQEQIDLFNPEAGTQPGGAQAQGDEPAGTTGEPTTSDAVAVIRDYYAAINAGIYDRAYALWSDGGEASEQTPQQFTNGFAGTTHVVAEIGTPGREDAGAGQRHVEVPVTVAATQGDGSVRRYLGSYTLHRTVVDGASDEQRSWRIASADLRLVNP